MNGEKEMLAMPNDVELEKAVLGAILLESDAVNSVMNIITADGFFYNDRNRKIWAGMLSLYIEQIPIDSVTLFDRLKQTYKSASQDLALYITQITNSIGSAANIETHALLLKELYIRRRVIEIGATGQQNGYDNTQDAFDTYDKILTGLNDLNGEINRAQIKTFADIVEDKILHLQDAANSHTYKTGISTMLSELDRVTLGFQDTDLIIIAGRPSMGKTAFAIDIARKQAKTLNAPVAIFSLEMSASQLTDRILSAETQIPLENIRKGGLVRYQWDAFNGIAAQIKKYPIHICDNGGMSINEICAVSKNWKLKHNIKAIYIDYIQLISNVTGNRNANREQEISGISRRLKQLAKELRIPVIALSQLSRACEARSDKRPMLSDLRESGAIEQDADMVIFPYRDEYYNPAAERGLTELIIGKNRNGKVGDVQCYFNADFQLFTNHPLDIKELDPFDV